MPRDEGVWSAARHRTGGAQSRLCAHTRLSGCDCVLTLAQGEVGRSATAVSDLAEIAEVVAQAGTGVLGAASSAVWLAEARRR